MLVEALPERIVGLQPPGDRLRVGQSGLLTVPEPLGRLEVEQVVVLSFAEALCLGLLRSLVAAVFALNGA